MLLLDFTIHISLFRNEEKTTHWMMLLFLD